MPNTQSARKALRQTQRRRTQNLVRKTQLKKAMKSLRDSISAQDKQGATTALSNVFKTADKVAKSGYIKQNKASRIKSRTTKLVTKAFSQSKE